MQYQIFPIYRSLDTFKIPKYRSLACANLPIYRSLITFVPYNQNKKKCQCCFWRIPMMLINIVLVAACSLALIISPLLKSRAKIQYNLRFLSCIFIVICGCNFISQVFIISWFNSVMIAVVYLITIIVITKLIEYSKRKYKRHSQDEHS